MELLKRLNENLQMFLVGALCYCDIELVVRGFTHWSMFLAGGLCVVVLHYIYMKKPTWPLWKKCLAGMLVITLVELAIGCVVNLWLGWGIWDYSGYRFNLWGQVCFPFVLYWFFLSLPIVGLSRLAERVFAGTGKLSAASE